MTALDAQLLSIDTLLHGDVAALDRDWSGLGEDELRQEVDRYRHAISSVAQQLTQLGT